MVTMPGNLMLSLKHPSVCILENHFYFMEYDKFAGLQDDEKFIIVILKFLIGWY